MPSSWGRWEHRFSWTFCCLLMGGLTQTWPPPVGLPSPSGCRGLVSSHHSRRFLVHATARLIPETARNESAMVPFMAKAGAAVDSGVRMDQLEARPGWGGRPWEVWVPRASLESPRSTGPSRQLPWERSAEKGGACGSGAWEVAGAGLGWAGSVGTALSSLRAWGPCTSVCAHTAPSPPAVSAPTPSRSETETSQGGRDLRGQGQS